MSEDSKSKVESKGPATPAVKASKQGLICMWHGLTVAGLIRLIRLKPRFSWSYLPRWLSIVFVSVFNSIYSGVESLVFGRRVRETTITHPPIFILGHWRSGTTMLHNLMSMDPQVTFPNLYHCVNPSHFLLTEKIVAPLTRAFLPATRPMDNVATGWNEPQEEDIALALDCGISPYLMTTFSDRREVYERFFDPGDMSDNERTIWKDSFLRLMKKLTYRQNKSIVTKNPGHTFRIPILLEMFPDARFVYIKRDPYAVYQSTLHLRRTMFSENALGPPDFSGSEEDTLYFYEKCIRTYEGSKHLIPQGRLHEMRFEDLEMDPHGEIRKVYESLSLPGWERLEPKINNLLPSLRAYKKNEFFLSQQHLEIVNNRLKWVLQLYGYGERLASHS